ncbi:transcription/translation regulatory transformer protein RfaH [Shewanella sp. AS1]|uniref:transcription/translation regulatory transformer protein RfaH n=1 Tax=Shewanella sp. AS1 TaxID=2907626 RepID=UPI001F36ED0B|nr:transcription/translation regulatory transformer protein RfaH [Shewanella sp. AS1]MCE9680049.1 transcription/translation regulatory transformer protein RfaH [Shewanella sp. AS1]
MKSWYLLYCKSRNEARAQDNLKLQQIETYLPMHLEKVSKAGKPSVKRAPLFPNYLFIYFDPKETSVSRIHSTRGVSRFVGCKEEMTAIDDSIIHAIRMKEHKLFNELDVSGGGSESQPEFKPGDRVKFVDGPFVDLEGIFAEKSGEKRCHILFEIMGQQKRVNVAKESLKPVGN